MSATLLMMSGHRIYGMKQKEEKKDIGTCFNCCYQGTGAKECNTCKRSFMCKYYKAPENLTDKFKIEG